MRVAIARRLLSYGSDVARGTLGRTNLDLLGFCGGSGGSGGPVQLALIKFLLCICTISSQSAANSSVVLFIRGRFGCTFFCLWLQTMCYDAGGGSSSSSSSGTHTTAPVLPLLLWRGYFFLNLILDCVNRRYDGQAPTVGLAHSTL